MLLTAHMIQLHLFRSSEGNLELLIMQRAPEEEIYPNLWQVITGRLEADETAMQAARREVLEETGLRPVLIFVLPYVATFFNSKTDTVNHVPVFAAEVRSDEAVVLSEEHQDYRWVSAEEAERMLPLPTHREGTRVLIDSLNRGTLETFGV